MLDTDVHWKISW